MSYDVELQDALGSVLEMPEPFTDGGTHVMGGTTLCELNVTYNYAEVFGSLMRDLDGKTVTETIGKLTAFVEQWPNVRPYRDYWAPTPGNAKAAVLRLISFADAHPDGVWRVS